MPCYNKDTEKHPIDDTTTKRSWLSHTNKKTAFFATLFFIDKMDILWYNTDMNTITAVVSADGEKKRISKHFEIAVPKPNAQILSAGKTFSVAENSFAVIPPLTEYVAKKATLITVEKALLPCKDITVSPDSRGEIYNICKQADFYAQSQLAKKELILSALGGLLVAFATAFADGVKCSPVTETVRTEILNNLSNVTFSLEAAIKKLPLNYDYVRKLFQKETGVTPLEFLTRERMNFAKNLLQSGISNQYSGYTVSQIAEACGFSEPLYFSRVFKKYYGVSPTEYSKK